MRNSFQDTWRVGPVRREGNFAAKRRKKRKIQTPIADTVGMLTNFHFLCSFVPLCGEIIVPNQRR